MSVVYNCGDKNHIVPINGCDNQNDAWYNYMTVKEAVQYKPFDDFKNGAIQWLDWKQD